MEEFTAEMRRRKQTLHRRAANMPDLRRELMNLNPAVQPPRPAAGLRSITSTCSADHPPGDNRFFRKQLRPKAGSRLTRRQPPVLGSREKRNSAPEGRPL